jgi:hypothetical protein
MARKYLFKTRQEAEDSYKQEHSKLWITEDILDAALEGDITWFKGTYMKVGLVRPLRAHGGLVVIRWKESKVNHAMTFDSWAREVRERVALGGMYPEQYEAYELMTKVQTTINEAYEAKKNEVA